MSFNIGDKVRVCSEDAMDMYKERTDYDYDIVMDMYDYCDREYTVSFVRDDFKSYGEWIRFEEDNEYYAFHSDLLELVETKVKDVEPNMCFKRHGYSLMVAGIIKENEENESNKVKLLMVSNEENFGWKTGENDGYFRDDEGVKYYDELRFQPKDGKWIRGWWYTFDADKTMEELSFTRLEPSKFIIDTLEEEEDEVIDNDATKDVQGWVEERWVPTHVLHVASEVNDIVEFIREATKRIEMLKKLGFDVELTDNKVSCSRNGVTYSVVVDNEVID